MKRQRLRGTDLILSNICYGTGNFGEKLTKEDAFRNLDAFVDTGGNFIDTANVYCRWVPGMENCSEQYIGEWLKKRGTKEDVVIATKGGHYDLNRPEVSRVTPEEIRKDLEESLLTLGMDQIDVYWLHRDNPDMPVVEIIGMMEELVKEGKIRYYGASNFEQGRINSAVRYSEKNGIAGFSAVSNQWSMARVNPGCNLNGDKTLVMMDPAFYQWHQASGMPIIPYSSSAHGYFQKLYQAQPLSKAMGKAYYNQKNTDIFERLCRLRAVTGASVQALTLAWLINQPFQVFPVAAVTKPEQMTQLAEASELSVDADFIESFRP